MAGERLNNPLIPDLQKFSSSSLVESSRFEGAEGTTDTSKKSFAARIKDIFVRQKRVERARRMFKENPTAKLIEEEIEDNKGSIPFSRFMEMSLYGPDGYYSAGKVRIGGGGHFLTSPELSDLFGGTIGNGLKRLWDNMDQPSSFRIVEMGAGNGTMARTLLAWTRKLHPEFSDAIDYTIIEYSDGLVARQKRQLIDFPNVAWVRGSAYETQLRNVEGAFISNELPDAFPVEVVTKIKGELKQKFISIEDNKFVEKWDQPSQEVLDYIRGYDIKIKNKVKEPINLNAVRFQRELDRSLKKGAIITIDYGRYGEVGGRGERTIRTFPFTTGKDLYRNPGNVDITASINFRVLEQIAEQDGLQVAFSGQQGDLLYGFGLRELDEEREVQDIADKSYATGNFYSHVLTRNVENPNDAFFQKA